MVTNSRLINIAQLKLDERNPRIPKSIRESNPTEQQLIEYMLLDASLIELMLAIGQNGYFPGEQLLVVLDTTDSKYRIVEGNRRFSAVKLLNNPELATVQKSKVQQVIQETTERPADIPCLVFDNEQEIHKYLGFKHITGIKEWRLLEKARYLYGLKETLFSDKNIIQAAKEIAKMIGSRMDYTRRVLVGFEVYKIIEEENNFYNIRDLNDKSFYFNYIVDSLNHTNIRMFLGVDFEALQPIKNLSAENLKKWTHWLFEKNDQNRTRLIGNSANLNDLNAIIANPAALDAFDNKGYSLDRAKELTGELDTIFRNFIVSACQSLEKADSLVIKVNDFYIDLDDDLKSIKLLADKIKSTVKVINSSNDE
jgi:acyl carrier protein